jgi:mannose-6-phosphate isomerase-like protein (cupin superfamily)
VNTPEGTSDQQPAVWLRDPYLEWTAREGVLVHEDFGVDLHKVETRLWPRYDVPAAFVHLKGRGDFMSLFVIDLPPGAMCAPQRHLFEEVVYVLSGHGSTTIEVDGERHSFEWGPNSLFALPLNARYQHFNGSGSEKARLVSANNLTLMMNLLHDEKFIFENDTVFRDRMGKPGYFTGEGERLETAPGRFMWETNFVADITAFKLEAWEQRGARSKNIRFAFADGVMHAHTSEMAVGTYKKGHRHGPDFHVLITIGEGYSLFWHEGEKDLIRVDWKPGVVFAPTDGIFHQHFNTSREPARYMAIALGSLRYPLTTDKVKIFKGVDVDVKQGGAQIEYTDQDPRIHALYLSELAKNGVKSEMGDQFDERGWRPGKFAPAFGAKPVKARKQRAKKQAGKKAAARKPAKSTAKSGKTSRRKTKKRPSVKAKKPVKRRS